MRLACRFLALTMLFVLAPITRASPIFYGLEFATESGSTFTCRGTGIDACIENSAIGKHYFGFFGVDSSLLESDGLNKLADVAFFFIQMEDNIWAYNFPGNNSLVGFRGPSAGCTGSCTGALSPGFDIVGGEIVRLHGGVFGWEDQPFVDFSTFGGDSFLAEGYRLGGFGPDDQSTFVWFIGGQMKVFRIPEPSCLVLLGLGLIGMATSRQARMSRQ